MPKIQVRDLEMHYEIHGRTNGEPLVLLHGFTDTGQRFDPFIDRLSRQYRLYVPDWRGHGKTNNPSGKIVHSELALDAAAFVDALGLGCAHFCGYSSGGMQLLFMVEDRPDLVHSLTLVATTYKIDEHVTAQMPGIIESISPDWIQKQEETHGATHGAGYGRGILDLWAESVFRPNEMPFTLKDLNQIKCPTLILHGDRDIFFPVHVPMNMYEGIPNSELCILPSCGHVALNDNSNLFITALLEFLSRHPIAAESL